MRALEKYAYPVPVPKDDISDFMKLESLGLTTYLKCDQASTELYGPELTVEGRSYIANNPKLKGPGIKLDWKFWLTIAVALAGVVIAYIDYRK